MFIKVFLTRNWSKNTLKVLCLIRFMAPDSSIFELYK